jgi:hypothetical protein
MGFVDIARRADRQIILLDPAEELAAVNDQWSNTRSGKKWFG